MFVRLDDGPRPFDDILQAQRFVGGLQQQSFQNAAAVHEMQQQQALGEAQLDVARQRNDILGRETRMRSVGRAMASAAKAGRALPAGVAGIQQMAAYLKQRNPEALAGVLAPFEGLPELPEGVDPLETEEGAALFEGLAGAWLAEQGAEAGEVASRVAVQAQTLMADPRAGLSDKDLEPLMALMEGGTATRAQIDAQYQAIRTKAAANIGFAEMRTAVLAEAQQAWGSAMTALRGGKPMPGLGEPTEADKLMELRGAIETATTPEELRAARGQYLVKAYGLDGVISEAEDAAFAAGEAAAMAAFKGAQNTALGRPSKAAPFMGGARAAGAGGGAVLDPERFPNLARGVEAEMGPNVLLGRQREALARAGFTEAPKEGTEEAREASRILDEEEARYQENLRAAAESVANGDDPASQAEARNVDVAVLEGVANQRASNMRFRRRVEDVWDKAVAALRDVGEKATATAKQTALVRAGAAKTRDEAARVLGAVEREPTPQELELLRAYAWHDRSSSGPEQDIAEWTGIPVQRVRQLLPTVRAGQTAQREADQSRRQLREADAPRQQRAAAGFRDRAALVREIAERMIDMEDGTSEVVREVFMDEYGFEPDADEIREARKLRAKLVKERGGDTGA